MPMLLLVALEFKKKNSMFFFCSKRSSLNVIYLLNNCSFILISHDDVSGHLKNTFFTLSPYFSCHFVINARLDISNSFYILNSVSCLLDMGVSRLFLYMTPPKLFVGYILMKHNDIELKRILSAEWKKKK